MTFTERSTAIPYALERVGEVMAPEPGNPLEAEGVLNPAAAWSPEGDLILFPRLVSAGNFSRVGRARVVTTDGVPTGVEREGVVLEPARAWEHGTEHGGTEDPRITAIPSLGVHVMTYVAFGPMGPRPALAISRDLTEWTRLGPVLFDYDDALDTDLNLFPNKDVVFFPEVVPAPDGTPSYAALHRPMWELGFSRPDEVSTAPAVAPDDRPSIWISYIPAAEVEADIARLVRFGSHRFVAGPAHDWEAIKIGAGPAPIRVPEGWLLLHHGVSGEISGGSFEPQSNVRYCAGAMLLDERDPSRLLARTPHPLLSPETDAEVDGIVANVVFPTAIEVIDGETYVFYGMADSRIGVARLIRVDTGARTPGDAS
ncbi:glycosidase [Galbitalea sp. SE-J8]|uniref:glycoside hydrolase family 130 protein n=1 Tax=Galbitalea sp. SE-J8 TaxID=3054952 RepID=UPI00259CBFFC|nr:glycosidase [Galbitalea sp. SE-J8]MDM4763528.1 glycosidase [Galbitalea sp. SE-J8]